MSHVPAAGEQVLSTLNADGSRRWLSPKLSKGWFWRRRRLLAWGLIALFTLLPHLRIGGRPAVLLDVAHRRFTFFGTTFLPTDTVLLMLLLVGIFVGIFLLTAVFGRVWCGWACPQTVYMEFLYRPIERLVEGRRTPRGAPVGGARTALKYALFVLVSALLAHTFLAWFVGTEALARWVTRSPLEHPAAFLVMGATTLLMLADFAWFREQTCLVACPYGRFQSVLLDRQSMIVGYDHRRGEPRARVAQRRMAGDRGSGDCIDCAMCVTTCPTGIDIRNGLQMECIGCTQCADACDHVMQKIGRPQGLIRYTSQQELEEGRRRLLRPRIVIYPLILAIVFGLFGLALARRTPADVTVLRGIGSPFTELPDGRISNQIRVKVVNRSDAPRRYLVTLVDQPSLRVVAPENPLPLAAGATGTATLFVLGPREAFPEGRRDVRFRVDDGAGYAAEMPYRLLGPEAPGEAR